jgi:hypothetical protein
MSFGSIARPEIGKDLGYGLGLGSLIYNGHRIVMHGGHIDGMSSWMAWSPDKGVGFVALSNSDHLIVPPALMFPALNPYFDLPDDDVLERLLPLREQTIAPAPEPESVPDTRSTLSPEHYAGTYSNVFGTFEIECDSTGTLTLRAQPSAYETKLRHVHFDRYAAEWDNPALLPFSVTFEIGADGAVRGLTAESDDLFDAAPFFPAQ